MKSFFGFLIFSSAIFSILSVATTSPPGDRPDSFKCVGEEECPKYHWCHSVAEHFGTVARFCQSNLNDTFGPPCNGNHTLCHENDSEAEDPSDSTSMCFIHNGTEACRRSYYMPCATEADCAHGFKCESVEFSDGSASVCLPKSIYQGGGGNCTENQDCGFGRAYFGYKWMPCDTIAGSCVWILA